MFRPRTHRHTLEGMLAAAVVVAIAGAAAAADLPRKSQPAKSVTAPTARVHAAKPAKPARTTERAVSGAAGMSVAIDPETGLLVKPTAQQRQALGVSSSPELDRSSEGLVVVTLPDGTQLCDLKGRFQEYVVARKDASGALRTDCVQTSESAARLMKAPAVPRTGLVRATEASRVKE